MDRFIAGGPVADAGLRMVWRNTMQSPRQTRVTGLPPRSQLVVRGEPEFLSPGSSGSENAWPECLR